MKLLLLSFICLSLCLPVLGQNTKALSQSISDCTGAVTISESGEYQMQFPGKNGSVDDLKGYASLSKINDNNSLYCSFKATATGRFSIKANSETPIQMIVFQSDSADLCQEISLGRAEIKRLIAIPNKEVGLGLNLNASMLFPLNLKEGEEVIIGFFTEKKLTSFIQVEFVFEVKSDQFIETSQGGKLIDMRDDSSKPGLSILLRDYETGKPVVANITLTGLKSITASYNGSDFRFPVDRSGKIFIKVDAEGYFFLDREEPVSPNSEIEVVLYMEPLGSGKSQKIDEIEFIPGSSEFLSTSDGKLKRLKDFLALNAYIKIEIQGHVHSNGENTFDGQKLSEARAKRVAQYLMENGIEKNRLSTVGFGNTQPVFPNAQFPSEEQANRRVEIKVL